MPKPHTPSKFLSKLREKQKFKLRNDALSKNEREIEGKISHFLLTGILEYVTGCELQHNKRLSFLPTP